MFGVCKVLNNFKLIGSKVRQIGCLLNTSDAADEEDSVDLGGRRIIKKNVKVKV